MTGPPRMLLGASLLFWGGMTDRALVALGCAVLIEGAHWTRIRWDFADKASLLAWRLSVLLLLIAMVLVLLQGARLNAMGLVFTWLPVILLPLQFVQSYGKSGSMGLGTFSMLIRRRKEHALKFGLPFQEVRFSFGYVYFCAILLASCLGLYAGTIYFYPVMVILVGWAFATVAGRGWRQLGVASLVALVLSAAGGLAGQQGLSALYRYLTEGRFGSSLNSRLDYRREMQTSIGNLGALKQSPEIKWRLIREDGPLPRLLRVASYSEYASAATWWGVPRREASATREEVFQSPAQIVNPANPDDPEDDFIVLPPNLPDPKVVADPGHHHFRLRGATPDAALFPLPANAVSLHRFPYEEFERNSFGTFRLKPSQPVADAEVLWNAGFATELSPEEAAMAGIPEGTAPPALSELQMPKAEAALMKRLVDELGLREGGLKEKVHRLQAYFARDFRYTRYNAVPRGHDPRSGVTLLGKFLNETKAGHCEFFATATTLLLREAGIPTRYVTGFAVVEFDRDLGEATIRGTHAHAWTRGWDAASGSWMDIDLTPQSWTELETRPSRYQALSDWFQRHREDFLVWRDQPGHMTMVVVVLLLPMLAGLGFIGRNLWRSRSRLDPARARSRGLAGVSATPLSSLEKPAGRILGERPQGTPVVPWLRQLEPRIERPETLQEALELHQRLRFDPTAEAPELVSRLQVLVAELRLALADLRG
ncbi:transglutaminase-like domain-containing protein [Luteolibacter marinus]|uniref:transglutaminase-like domain-containing protein n=1 Tax=Luteolibacter marinus TaxID=2776705 RepID=UPI001867C631|nr:transglutaminase-like domain-containing protein [Luteolibacter marinus]